MKTRLVRSVMNWIWIEQRANLQDKCLPRESSNLSEGRIFFTTKIFPSFPSSFLLLLTKITGQKKYFNSTNFEREFRAKFDMNFQWNSSSAGRTFLFRSLNVEGIRKHAFLEKLFVRGTLLRISPRSCALRVFSFPGRNWIVVPVTDSSEESSENFLFPRSILIAYHYRKSVCNGWGKAKISICESCERFLCAESR